MTSINSFESNVNENDVIRTPDNRNQNENDVIDDDEFCDDELDQDDDAGMDDFDESQSFDNANYSQQLTDDARLITGGGGEEYAEDSLEHETSAASLESSAAAAANAESSATAAGHHLTHVKSPSKISTGNNRYAHACLLCNKSFISKYLMQQHVMAVHEKKRFSCGHCTETFAYRSGRTRHIHAVHQKLRFLCKLCGQAYTSRETAQLHVKNKHKKRDADADFHLQKINGDNFSASVGLLNQQQQLQQQAFTVADTTTHSVPLSFSSRGQDLRPLKQRGFVKKEDTTKSEENNATTGGLASLLIQSYENGYSALPVGDGDKQQQQQLILVDPYAMAPFYLPTSRQQLQSSSGSPADRSISDQTSLSSLVQIPPIAVNLPPTSASVINQSSIVGALNHSQSNNDSSTPMANQNAAANHSNSNSSNNTPTNPNAPKHRWKCTMCDKTFAYNAGRSKHVRSVHMKVRYRCTLCNSLYTTKDYATQHVNSAHCITTKLPSDYVQQICDKNGEASGGAAFGVTLGVKRSLTSSGSDQMSHHHHHHKIGRINKSGAAPSRLTPSQVYSDDSFNNSHDQNHYDEENLYNFSGIQLMSSLNDVIDEHNNAAYTTSNNDLRDNDISTSNVMMNDVMSSDGGDDVINVSNNGIATTNTPNMSTLSVTTNLPFHCLQCGVGYPTQETLTYHVSLEHEEEKLTCDYCGQSWLRPSSLIGHLKSAHPHLAYRCTVCDKTFECPTTGSHHVELDHQCDPSHCLIHVTAPQTTTASGQ